MKKLNSSVSSNLPKKKKAIAPIFMLVLGSVMMGGGFLADYAIKDMVQGRLDEGLLGIEEQGVPLVAEMVKEMGIPEALRGIKEQGVPIVEEMVLEIGSGEVLNQIRGEASPIVEEMVLQMGIAEVLTQINDLAVPMVVNITKQLGIAEVLAQINDIAVPMVVDIVKQLGIAEVLSEINATAIPIVIELVKQVGVAEVLSQIRDTAMPIIEDMVNNTFVATLIQTVFDGLELTMDTSVGEATVSVDPATRAEFFNDDSYQFDVDASVLGGLMNFDVFEISGVAYYTGASDLTYSTTAQDRLLDGNATDTPESPYYLPGVLQDIDSGSGVGDFLALYEAAAGDSGQETDLANRYDASWTELTYFRDYLIDYLEAEMIPLVIEGTTVGISGILEEDVDLLGTIMPELTGAESTDDIAEWVFYELWAEGTALGNVVYEGGLDFGEMVEEIPEGATGFEVVVPPEGPTNIDRDTAIALWDESDDLSLLSMDGMEIWYGANESSVCANYTNLKSEFGLTDTQMNYLLEWLWYGEDCFSEYLLPILLESPFGYDMSIEAFSQILFYEIWANGTAFGEVIYPGGMDFGGLIEEIPKGTIGFEVGVPTPTGLTADEVDMLWDPSDPYSLFTMDGMEIWLGANESSSCANYTNLQSHFGITTTQMDMILDWLWEGEDCFSQTLVEPLVLYQYEMSIEDFAQLLFYEIWANGTAFGEIIYPEGMDFGDLIEEIPKGTIGFELGVPVATGLSADQVAMLWDPEDPYSLFSMDGMEYWVEANENDTVKATLTSHFSITETQTQMILDWLWEGEDCFSQALVEPLVLYQYEMPIEEFAQLLFYEIWANGTAFGEVIYPEGMDFGDLIEEIPKGTIGFEVGYPIATGLTADDVMSLWNASDDLSLFSMEGMEYWVEANTNDSIKDMLRTHFDITETQMDMILDWLWNNDDCFSQGLVPILVESEYGYNMTVEELAELLFMEQWTNGTILGDVLFNDGIDFGEMMDGIPLGTIGFEVGVPIPLNLTGEQCTALWDETNSSSLFSMDGMALWFEANSSAEMKETLRVKFALTEIQMQMILDWLFLGEDCFSKSMIPPLIQFQYEMSMTDFALSLLLEQWTNGTVFGDVMYEGGLEFSEMMDAIKDPLTGFEVGVPDATGIPYTSAVELFNDDNEKSLTNDDGIEIWIEAQDDDDKKDELMEGFDLTEDQTDAILDWMDSFKEDVVPVLMELPVEDGGRGMTLDKLARTILLEQWCNATADGRSIYPYGFPLPLKAGVVYGFEVGYQDPDTKVESTEISLDSAEKLWDKDSDTALANKEGLAKWWEAVEDPDSDTADELQDANDLDDKAMGMVLEWLPKFRDNVMPYLAQEEMELPADTNTLGSLLVFGGLAIGGICVGVSAVGYRRHVAKHKWDAVISKDKSKKKKDKLMKQQTPESTVDFSDEETEKEATKETLSEIPKKDKGARVDIPETDEMPDTDDFKDLWRRD